MYITKFGIKQFTMVDMPLNTSQQSGRCTHTNTYICTCMYIYIYKVKKLREI